MRLLLDEDLSPQIAVRLRARGVDAVSIHEVGRRGLSDREQLKLAAADGRCFVTRNRNDFLLLTREFFERGEPHRGLLILSSRVPPDRFDRIATLLAAVAQRHGDSPTEFLCDFVSG